MKITKFVLISMLAIIGISNWACKKDSTETQKISFNGIELTAKGDATMEKQGDVLVVSNLGDSTEDAISYDFPATNGPDSIEWKVDFADPNLSADLPDGAKRIIAFKNKDGQLIGERWIEKRGESRLLGFDYSSLGSTTTKLELFQDDELIDVIDYTQNTILMQPTAAGSFGGCICCSCVPIQCFPDGCIVRCTYRTLGGYNPVIAGYPGINRINILPVIPGTALGDNDNIISTMEISTENIETLSISAIEFN